jgi:hypothetical protein
MGNTDGDPAIFYEMQNVAKLFEFRSGHWIESRVALPFVTMLARDVSDEVPRRIEVDGKIVAWGRNCFGFLRSPKPEVPRDHPIVDHPDDVAKHSTATSYPDPCPPGASLEEWRNGTWLAVELGPVSALGLMLARDNISEKIPRRVTHGGNLIAAGRWCSRDTPVNREHTAPFWIVVSLDKPGPVERGERPDYRQHDSEYSAATEARRLSQACAGGRFGICRLVRVVGWIDHDLDQDIAF